MADRRLPQAMHLHAARHWHVCPAYQGNKAVLHASYNRACGQGLQILKNVCLPCGISKMPFIIRFLRASFFFVVNWFWKGSRNQTSGSNFKFVVSVLQLMPDGLVAAVLTTKKWNGHTVQHQLLKLAQTFDIQPSAHAKWQISAGRTAAQNRMKNCSRWRVCWTMHISDTPINSLSPPPQT